MLWKHTYFNPADVTNGDCSGSYSVTRTSTATDAYGNNSTASQTINVTDTTVPVIAGFTTNFNDRLYLLLQLLL
jgi:hypothetical protein